VVDREAGATWWSIAVVVVVVVVYVADTSVSR